MFNIVLVTVTKVEAQTVLDIIPKASGTPWKRRYIDGKTYYDLGLIGRAQIGMVQ